MPARKYLYQNLVDGEQYERDAIDTSDGSADAGEIVALNADGVLDDTILGAALSGPDVVVKTGPTGRLDMAIMPVGLGVDITELEASEGIGANNVVNIHYDAGAYKVRRADATNNRPAHGFVQESFAQGEIAAVYREGTNSGVSGLAATKVFLASTPGAVTTTPPTGAGVIQQQIGVAHSDTAFYFQAGKPVHLI